jgi:hypothetical protein
MVSVDPRSLKPVRSVDVAARKTARVLDEKSADASTVDEARKPEEV